jgi:Na+:H+ antiporter, NhaC family
MNLSPVITAGAIISGAYFGDKASPLAGSVNLVTAAAGSEIFEHIRESLWTSLPALLIAIGIFFLLGTPGEFDASPALSRLEGAFAITPWAFLPLLVVLALSLARMPPFVTIFAGALCGGILAVVHDPARVLAFAASPELPASLSLLKGVWSTLATGYSVKTGDAPLDAIVTRGGMVSMMTTVWLIIAAMSFGAIVEQAGFLQRLIDPIVARAKSVGAMFAAVVAISRSCCRDGYSAKLSPSAD